MKRSGYDEPDPISDWTICDEKFATIKAALVKRDHPGYWRRHAGRPFDQAEWKLVPEMWDHEHCDVCLARVAPGMTYWASSDNTFLCDMCYDPEVLGV
jgi:hypothetical protein